jgi:hypothetical protein
MHGLGLGTVASFTGGQMPAGCRRSFVSRQDAGAPLLAGRMPALLCQPVVAGAPLVTPRL